MSISEQDAFQIVQKIFVEDFGFDADQIKPDTLLVDDLYFDMVIELDELMMELECVTEVSFFGVDADDWTTVQDIINTIVRKA
jgi:acyl carrier protein